MDKRSLLKIEESFSAKIFFLFVLFTLAVVAAFTSVYTYSRSKELKESLVREGQTLVALLAYNARIGAFTENPTLLREALDEVTGHKGVLSAAIYHKDGGVLAQTTGIGATSADVPKNADGQVLDRVAEASFPVVLELRDRVDFWWVITAQQRWLSPEEMFLGTSPAGRNVIGYARLSLDKGRYGNEINHLLQSSLITSVCCLIAGSLVVYFFVRRITSPLNRLIEGVNLLGKGGYQKVPVETNDEIGRMAAAFNNLVETLKAREDERRRAEEEVLTLNVELERKVAERTAELKNANRELELFNYAASHDLRAPLARIQGFCELLSKDYAGKLDEQGLFFIERMSITSRQMDDIIRAMLALSKLNRAEILRARVSLTELAQGVATNLLESDPQRQNRFVIQPEVIAEGDVKMLRVVMENLLGNAWKFSAKNPQGVIEFGSSVIDGKTVFCVRDEGVGFDMQYADNLFSPFQRLHDASEFPGTGIGLAMVRRIIELHKGQVWAKSEEGKGTSVCFTLFSEA